MAQHIAYIGRGGEHLTPVDWKAKRADPSYCVVRQYDNAVVRLTLQWSGRVPNPQDTFTDYWPVFILLVQNYRPDGTLANDPADGDKTYPTEAAGIKAYEEFLLKWTESDRTAEGEFVEADNVLTPPPPPNLDAPLSTSNELDEGAW